MKVYLVKNKKYVFLDPEDHLLHWKQGIINGSQSNRVLHCGNVDGVNLKILELTEKFKNEGYSLVPFIKGIVKKTILDKAEWHFEGNFPKELNITQGYIHTGMFVFWLLEMRMISKNFLSFDVNLIDGNFRNIFKSPSSFYIDVFEGVFSINYLNDEIIPFVLDYYGYDFANSQYIDDYLVTLAKDCETVYHVQDSYSNYDKIKALIEEKYKKWILAG